MGFRFQGLDLKLTKKILHFILLARPRLQLGMSTGLLHFMAGFLTMVCIQGSKYVQPWEHGHKVKRKDIQLRSTIESTRNSLKINMFLGLPVLFDTNGRWLLLHYGIIILMCVSSICLPTVP